MNIDSSGFVPKVRSEEIVTKEVDGELLVYDRKRDKAHCLNKTAAAIWKLCDGETSTAEIALKLQTTEGSRQEAVGSEQLGGSAIASEISVTESSHTADTPHPIPDTQLPAPDTQLVWLALDQLRRSHLLEEAAGANGKTFCPPAIPSIAGMSRREAVRRISLSAAIALPLVISMTAPTAEASTSCKHHCDPCTTSAECCGVCSSTVPGCVGPMRCT